MTSRSVLICGAGPAGLALATLLGRGGDRVTVVERAADVRGGGYAVDLRGEALDVAADLGVLDHLRGRQTGMRGTTVVDAAGAPVEELPAERFGGDLEVAKPVLTTCLADAAAQHAELVFGETVTAIADDRDGVRVGLARSGPRDVDLLVGADGVRSVVRRLAFGDHDRFLHHLGLSGAGFTTDNWAGLDHRGLLQPGDGAAAYLFSGADRHRMTVSLSFATASAHLDRRPRGEQQAAIRAAFTGQGWLVPRLLDTMEHAEDFYFASAQQVVLRPWSRGRVVLLGDAAGCAAPTSGMGTSQALLAARCLAGELAGADHRTAFAAYERRLRPVVEANQALGRAAAAEFGGR